MKTSSGPITKEACYLLPEIDAALPASVENTNLIIRLGALFDAVEKLEISIGQSASKNESPA